MANVKRCDRCGNYYEKSTVKYKPTGDAIPTIVLYTNSNLPMHYIDLCDNCMQTLFNFLKGENINESKNSL